MKYLKLIWCLLLFSTVIQANPVHNLLERLEKGASKHFILEKVKSDKDFFELESKGNKIVVRGNTYVNLAAGVRWYLKYYVHANISWNNMNIALPAVLPTIPEKECHETDILLRYDLNYCTYSYSMAFWDWERWEREIDWMALHGINMPLTITGTECVWFNVLKKLGYSHEEINEFISGPGFFAWWLMNNLEGWGGPNPDSWYVQRAALQKKIINRMRELDIEPVFAGYSGMVPNNAKEKLSLNVTDPGIWCGYRRPAFLQPTDPKFAQIAELYYKEMTRLFGKANYYSMDPFHEGGSIEGVNLEEAGKAIMSAMKQCNPKAAWVAQAWGANPRAAMIKNLNKGDMVVLDLYSESRPQWGDPESTWYRKEGFNGHDWIYCMLLNYGGNVGLHGKMQHVIDEYFKARSISFGKTLKGVGITMEGIENNPVMYELLCELPWHTEKFSKDEWLKGYVTSRYGSFSQSLYEAWVRLGNSIYNCPVVSTQQGTHESVFCARPSDEVYQVSSWSEMSDYYNPMEVIQAAEQFASVADSFRGNNNYEYDLVDIVRQAVAEKGRMVYKMMIAAKQAKEKTLFKDCSRRFMELLMWQDRLLSTRPEFGLDTWVNRATHLGNTPEEKKLYEWNAKVQITTWGNRKAADEGGLRDYAHREWSGLLKDFYAMRWQVYIDETLNQWDADQSHPIDYYALEEKWIDQPYHSIEKTKENAIKVAKEILSGLFY
ncbi:alpha-N-acetylglucosaminidase [Bacteroides sp.]|uniref:alpha-N-acetylglucosaminidase n=1 Tax=Bacteroides sp. TaxID=29523 RepID=UPI00262E2DDD|nr:alpha-N-acetylglucosaminidase [Bacteroides sp.]